MFRDSRVHAKGFQSHFLVASAFFSVFSMWTILSDPLIPVFFVRTARSLTVIFGLLKSIGYHFHVDFWFIESPRFETKIVYRVVLDFACYCNAFHLKRIKFNTHPTLWKPSFLSTKMLYNALLIILLSFNNVLLSFCLLKGIVNKGHSTGKLNFHTIQTLEQ